MLDLLQVLDNLFPFVGVLSPEGILLEANNPPLEIAGLSREEVIGFPFAQTYWWSYSQEAQDHIHQAIAKAGQGEAVRFDIEVRVKNDQRITIDFFLNPLRDHTGTITHLIASGVDISERKRIEEALRTSEERFEFAIQGNKDGIWDWDATSNQVYFSPQWKAMLGYEEEEIGNGLEEWDSRIHPEDRSACYEALHRHFRQETPVYVSEHRLRCKDGQYKWVLDRGKVIAWRENGEPQRVIGTHTDITDRKKGEMALAQLAAIIESSQDAIISKTLDGIILTWNQGAEALLGFTATEMVGQSIFTLIPPELALQEREFLTQVAQGQLIHAYETQRRHRDGRIVVVSVTLSPMRDGQGIIGVSAIARDITDQKQVERALQQQAKQEQTLRTLTHAIRQSLDLDTILHTAVTEVRQVLGGDRVVVCRWDDQGRGEWLVESARGSMAPILWKDRDLPLLAGEPFQHHEAVVIGDSQMSTSPHWADGLVRQMEGRAAVWVPICVGEDLWGLLGVVQNDQPRAWQSWEIDLLQQIADQMAIAIHQSELYQRLEQGIAELQQRNLEMQCLQEMNDFLQACTETEEACRAVTALIPSLFPHCSGSIALINNSRNYLETLASWGELPPSRPIFDRQDCWCLRRGKSHGVSFDHQPLLCSHFPPSPQPLASLCLPLVAAGETLGIFSVYTAADASSSALSPRKQQLAGYITEQISLIIANLTLRETLQRQSICDPLTGLFNRRYLEEFLSKEMHRAVRENYAIGMIMLDIDHFKDFNDLLGHDAGDYVLKNIASLLQHAVRDSDTICRYGGEELILILPNSNLPQTLNKAEAIRAAIANLQLSYRGQPLNRVTASFGVGIFPDHGSTVAELIHRSDEALYRAKGNGRNQVCQAE